MKKSPLKCLFVSSEVAPYAKTGGLADVVGALPKELRQNGIDVRVAMPYYSSMYEKYFDHDKGFLTSYDVYLNWRKQGVGIYYNNAVIPTYFIKSDAYFYREGLYGYHDDYERFAFFCKAVLELIKHIDFVPDIIHCNDWQTGPLCLLLKEKYRYDPMYANMKTVFTIHNMKYQGLFGKEALEVLELSDSYMSSDKIEFNGAVSYMKAGLVYSDKITTVSPTYAEEIKTPGYGCGLDGLLRNKLYYKLEGILNGLDYNLYDPATDTRIYEPYDISCLEKKEKNKRAFQEEYGLKQDGSMLISIISRITNQKGFDLLKHTIDHLWIMDKIMQLRVQIAILGTGDYEYENMFKHFAYKYSDRSAVFITFDETIAQKIYAASDAFLMPSAFEPCGLGQLMAMRYGTVPIVRNTGGLKDTVTHYNSETKQGTGFEFEDYSGYWLYRKIEEAYWYYTEKRDDFKQIMCNCMQADFSWEESARKYQLMYQKLVKM